MPSTSFVPADTALRWGYSLPQTSSDQEPTERKIRVTKSKGIMSTTTPPIRTASDELRDALHLKKDKPNHQSQPIKGVVNPRLPSGQQSRTTGLVSAPCCAFATYLGIYSKQVNFVFLPLTATFDTFFKEYCKAWMIDLRDGGMDQHKFGVGVSIEGVGDYQLSNFSDREDVWQSIMNDFASSLGSKVRITVVFE